MDAINKRKQKRLVKAMLMKKKVSIALGLPRRFKRSWENNKRVK